MRALGPDEWMKMLSEFEGSGLSQKEFVAKHDLSFSTFQYWLYRKSKTVRAESASPQRFLPVVAVPSPALVARADVPTRALEVIELELPSGVRVRLPASTSPGFLGALVASLK